LIRLMLESLYPIKPDFKMRDCIELLVAFLQAYIFTLLSALFIGMAMPEHHHD